MPEPRPDPDGWVAIATAAAVGAVDAALAARGLWTGTAYHSSSETVTAFASVFREEPALLEDVLPDRIRVILMNRQLEVFALADPERQLFTMFEAAGAIDAAREVLDRVAPVVEGGLT